jgi:PEP-CTERM motif
MGRLYLCVLAAATVGVAVLISPVGAHADSLTGLVGINWFSPNTSTTFAKDTIAVGSTLNCPGSSPICAGYGFGTQTFSVGTSAISSAVVYLAAYNSGAFDGFDFTGLTFLAGGSLNGFTLTTNIAGLTSANVTFGPSNIEINLQSLPAGNFTLNLLSGGGETATPEPSSLALVAAGVLGLLGLGVARRKLVY